MYYEKIWATIWKSVKEFEKSCDVVSKDDPHGDPQSVIINVIKQHVFIVGVSWRLQLNQTKYLDRSVSNSIKQADVPCRLLSPRWSAWSPSLFHIAVANDLDVYREWHQQFWCFLLFANICSIVYPKNKVQTVFNLLPSVSNSSLHFTFDIEQFSLTTFCH